MNKVYRFSGILAFIIFALSLASLAETLPPANTAGGEAGKIAELRAARIEQAQSAGKRAELAAERREEAQSAGKRAELAAARAEREAIIAADKAKSDAIIAQSQADRDTAIAEREARDADRAAEQAAREEAIAAREARDADRAAREEAIAAREARDADRAAREEAIAAREARDADRAAKEEAIASGISAPTTNNRTGANLQESETTVSYTTATNTNTQYNLSTSQDSKIVRAPKTLNPSILIKENTTVAHKRTNTSTNTYTTQDTYHAVPYYANSSAVYYSTEKNTPTISRPAVAGKLNGKVVGSKTIDRPAFQPGDKKPTK
ncbi:MAG: hypothetical protein WC890_06455 [Candidatus Margulisiibacteriota bacterium]